MQNTLEHSCRRGTAAARSTQNCLVEWLSAFEWVLRPLTASAACVARSLTWARGGIQGHAIRVTVMTCQVRLGLRTRSPNT